MRWGGVTWLRRVQRNWLSGTAACNLTGSVALPRVEIECAIIVLSPTPLHDITQPEEEVVDASAENGAVAAKTKAAPKAKKVGLDEIPCVGGMG